MYVKVIMEQPSNFVDDSWVSWVDHFVRLFIAFKGICDNVFQIMHYNCDNHLELLP